MSPTAIFALKGDKPSPEKPIYFNNPQQNRLCVLDTKSPLQQISCFFFSPNVPARVNAKRKNPHGGLASK